jgi:hypothetical protein
MMERSGNRALEGGALGSGEYAASRHEMALCWVVMRAKVLGLEAFLSSVSGVGLAGGNARCVDLGIGRQVSEGCCPDGWRRCLENFRLDRYLVSRWVYRLRCKTYRLPLKCVKLVYVFTLSRLGRVELLADVMISHCLLLEWHAGVK